MLRIKHILKGGHLALLIKDDRTVAYDNTPCRSDARLNCETPVELEAARNGATMGSYLGLTTRAFRAGTLPNGIVSLAIVRIDVQVTAHHADLIYAQRCRGRMPRYDAATYQVRTQRVKLRAVPN